MTGLKHWNMFQVDHKLPASKGGTDQSDNLVLTCGRCNMRKGAKTDVEFIAWLRMRGEA